MPFGQDKPHSWLREDDEFDRYNKPGSSDWFELSDDVSFKKPNNRHDTLKVESLLGYGGYMDLEKTGGAMGLTQGTLEQPIKLFQEKNGLEVDGLLKPGGPTIKKLKALYGNVFGRTPAPTPAMVDANAEVTHAGEDGFLYDQGPTFALKPNRRLDGKAHRMEYERWNRDWARGSGDNPKSLAPEYESYIRQIDPKEGHDPGLIFARDIVEQVGKYHGQANGAELAKHLAVRLSDRPDLQQQLLGGPVPTSPPIGTFKDGTGDGAKAWIDNDRVANGLPPKFGKQAPVQRLSARAAPASNAEPDPKNLLEYGPNSGLPEDEATPPSPMPETDERPLTRDDLSPTALAIQQGRENSRREPGVQIAMAPGAIPPLFAFEPSNLVDVTTFDGAWSKIPAPPHASDLPSPKPPQPEERRPPPLVSAWPDRVPQIADELPAMGPDGTRRRRPIGMPETRDLANVDAESFAEIDRTAAEDFERINAELAQLTQRLERLQNGQAHFAAQAAKPPAESVPEGMAQSTVEMVAEDLGKTALGFQVSPSPIGMVANVAKNTAKGDIEERVIASLLSGKAGAEIRRLGPQIKEANDLLEAHKNWLNRVQEERERRHRANP
jgi:hypothetical protein